VAKTPMHTTNIFVSLEVNGISDTILCYAIPLVL